jgi:hypothetical protein
MSCRSRFPCVLATLVTAGVTACDIETDDVDALGFDACIADDAGNCAGGGNGGEAGGGAGEGGSPGGGTTPGSAPTIDIIWEGNGGPMANDVDTLTVAIDDGDGTFTYRFGMSQTGAPNGWNGEDCLPGVLNGKDVCHDVGAEGEILSSTSKLALVDDERTLLFKASHDAGEITYVVIRVETDECWTFGDDPSWYMDSLLKCAAYDSP